MTALTPTVLQNEALLRALGAGEAFASMAALGRAVNRDPSNLRRSFKTLDDEGFTARPEGEPDAFPTLTDAGRRALAALDRAAGIGVELSAPWSAFKPHPLNPRKTFDVGKLDELGADILARGQDQNIVCRPAGADGVLYIRSGERRWRSIGRMIEAGRATENFEIRYVVRDEDDTEHLIGALGENFQRADLNPVEEARALAYMRDELGMSTAVIAERISKTQRFVQLRLQLLTAPEITQVALAAGKITVQEALAAVQQAKPKPAEPPAWTPANARVTLLLVEIAHACGGEHGTSRRAPLAYWPNDPDLNPLVHNAAVGYGSNAVFINAHTDEVLDRIGLNPTTDPTALYRARQAAGLNRADIAELEGAGRYRTPYLNPAPPAAASPHSAAATSVGAASPAAPSRSFADQVAEAADDEGEDEPETAEMFPEAGEQRAPETAAQAAPAVTKRDPFRHAREVTEAAARDGGAFLIGIEHDGDFDWAAAECPALADQLAFYFANETILGVIGVAAALYARGGDMFSERALRGAYDRLRRKALTDIAYLPQLDQPVKPGFDLDPTGEIMDAQDGGRLATLEEGVSQEDAAAMSLAPELLRAVRGLLAVMPTPDPDDDDVEAETALRYAAEVMALATRRADP